MDIGGVPQLLKYNIEDVMDEFDKLAKMFEEAGLKEGSKRTEELKNKVQQLLVQDEFGEDEMSQEERLAILDYLFGKAKEVGEDPAELEAIANRTEKWYKPQKPTLDREDEEQKNEKE